jgi:hypothetical protein
LPFEFSCPASAAKVAQGDSRRAAIVVAKKGAAEEKGVRMAGQQSRKIERECKVRAFPVTRASGTRHEPEGFGFFEIPRITG